MTNEIREEGRATEDKRVIANYASEKEKEGVKNEKEFPSRCAGFLGHP